MWKYYTQIVTPFETRVGEVARHAELDEIITGEFAHLAINNIGKVKPGSGERIGYMEALDAKIRIASEIAGRPLSLMDATILLLEESDARPANTARIAGLLVLRHGIDAFTPRLPVKR